MAVTTLLEVGVFLKYIINDIITPVIKNDNITVETDIILEKSNDQGLTKILPGGKI